MQLRDPVTAVVDLASSVVDAIGGYFKSDADKAQAVKDIAIVIQNSAALQGQATIAEIQSQDKFKSRWRPALGWVCVIGLGAQWVVIPVLSSILHIFNIVYIPPMIDTGSIIAMVSTLLGLGGLRTIERVQGKA